MNHLTIVTYHYVRPIKGSKFPTLKGLEIKKFINNYRKKWGLKTKFLNLNKLMLYLNY